MERSLLECRLQFAIAQARRVQRDAARLRLNSAELLERVKESVRAARCLRERSATAADPSILLR
jgi:hypothetical protein